MFCRHFVVLSSTTRGGWKFRDNGHLGLRIRVRVGFLVDGILVRFLAFRRRRFKDRQVHAVNEEHG